jgi:hypothetical protein
VDGLRRSPGFASEDGRKSIQQSAFSQLQEHPTSGFCRRPSRNCSRWTAAIFSLTVARQRGNCTRFPVFAKRQRRANRRTFQRTGNRGVRNLPGWSRGSQIAKSLTDQLQGPRLNFARASALRRKRSSRWDRGCGTRSCRNRDRISHGFCSGL